MPIRAVSVGSAQFAHKTSVVEEDFDDGLTLLWFPDDLIAQITVSRNHASGYRIETWIFGGDGDIHVGRFEQNKNEVILEAYGRSKRLEYKVFPMRDYGRPVPEFVERFGLAYKQELAALVCARREGTNAFNVPIGLHLKRTRRMTRWRGREAHRSCILRLVWCPDPGAGHTLSRRVE